MVSGVLEVQEMTAKNPRMIDRATVFGVEVAPVEVAEKFFTAPARLIVTFGVLS